MKKISFSLLCLFIVFFSCKKENKHAQWDVEAIGPLLHASLAIDHLISSTSTVTNADQSIRVIYERDLYDMKLDSLYQIPDTSIATVSTWPIFRDSIHPATTFFANNQDVVLSVSGAQLTDAIIRSGTIRLEARNTLPSAVTFTYIIPGALKNGIAFRIVQDVSAASGGVPGFFSGDFDFSEYSVHLRGSSGTDFNSVSYQVIANADSSGQTFVVNFGDTLINLTSTLIDITPSYVHGYLGQSEVMENAYSDVGFGRMIGNGTILLDSVRMNLDIENSIGVDARIIFNSFASVNDRTGNTVNLSAPSLMNIPININRASESGPPISPVQSTHTHFLLDNSNSNIKAFVENLPQRLSYDLNLQVNPLANVSGYHDFVYSDYLVNAKLKFEMPLRFAADQLMLVDTQDLSLSNFTRLDPIGPSTLTLVAINGYPFDIDLRLLLLDDNRTVTDSLFIPGLIHAAPLDAAFRVINARETRILVPVDAAQKQRILDSHYSLIHARFTTPAYPQLVQIYSTYTLDLRLIGDGVYSIR